MLALYVLESIATREKINFAEPCKAISNELNYNFLWIIIILKANETYGLIYQSENNLRWCYLSVVRLRQSGKIQFTTFCPDF